MINIYIFCFQTKVSMVSLTVGFGGGGDGDGGGDNAHHKKAELEEYISQFRRKVPILSGVPSTFHVSQCVQDPV
jgi:hypothetical protein